MDAHLHGFGRFFFGFAVLAGAGAHMLAAYARLQDKLAIQICIFLSQLAISFPSPVPRTLHFPFPNIDSFSFLFVSILLLCCLLLGLLSSFFLLPGCPRAFALTPC